jgi:TRAP-type C4-dicarboxylate transport system permease large subunit
MKAKKEEIQEPTDPNTGFRELLTSMMRRRWLITSIVLYTFVIITTGILISIHTGTEVAGEWKELLLLLLGAFIGSYSKIIDYWFSDTDKDKMLVQKMDEEDGVSLSNTNN